MALCSAAQVRALSGGQAIPAAEDTLLGTLITRAGVVIAAHLGYPPATGAGVPTVESATYTRYTGDGGCYVSHRDRRVLYLEPYPVTEITSIHEDANEVYGSDTLISSDDYAITGAQADTVRLKPLGTHGYFDQVERRIKVAFTAGFTSIPADIEQAAIELVLHWWGLRQRRGMQSVASGEGLSTSYRGETIPDHVAQILGQYRLP